MVGREGSGRRGEGQSPAPDLLGSLIAAEAVDDADPGEEHGKIPGGTGQVGEEEEEGGRSAPIPDEEGEGVLPEEKGREEDQADVMLFGQPGAEPARLFSAQASVPPKKAEEGEEEEGGAEEEEEVEVGKPVVMDEVPKLRGEAHGGGPGNDDAESVGGEAPVFHAWRVEDYGQDAGGEGRGGRGEAGQVLKLVGGDTAQGPFPPFMGGKAPPPPLPPPSLRPFLPPGPPNGRPLAEKPPARPVLEGDLQLGCDREFPPFAAVVVVCVLREFERDGGTRGGTRERGKRGGRQGRGGRGNGKERDRRRRR